MNLEQAMQIFLQESAELLDDMERILLDAEADTIDDEQLGALFRAMHTIKGSAGLFGLDDMVAFTHQAENLLDLLRSHEISLNDELSGLLLRCHDHVKAQLAVIAGQPPQGSENSAELLSEIADYLARHHAPTSVGDTVFAQEHEPPAAETGEPRQWLLSLRFGPDMLRNGMDPASFIRYLATLGSVAQIAALMPGLPQDGSYDPETNYLWLEALFTTAVDEVQLSEVFEFAREDSAIFLTPADKLAEGCDKALQGLDDAGRREIIAVWRGWGLPVSADILCDPPPAALAATETAPVAATQDTPSGEPVETAKPQAEPRSGIAKPMDNKFIKVEAGKLDNLINLIGELVIAGAAANLMARRSGQSPLVESTMVIANLIEQIRAETLSMRMVQIGEIFSRFPRVVRDVSKELNKQIKLVISGAETELDKSMVEKLGDPLMHIVRNAIDHGIESLETRRANGKPDEGRVWLNAYHESGSVVIEVADDGGGLSRERILAKAVERGVVSPDAMLAEQDIYRLIFEPGFSTAPIVTNLSGRGVGLDVVKKSIEQLRGSLEIDTEAGLGTTFRLRLPLTLAIIDGFLVEIGRSTFVIPLETVIECMELPAELAADAGKNCLDLRGEALPLLHLRRFLDLPGEPGRRRNIVVVKSGDAKAGLVVDALQGEFQTVIKPLGSLFRHLKAISGSTILGTGDVALILDVPALIQHAAQQEAEHYSLNRELTQQAHRASPALPTTTQDSQSGNLS
ncbi:chemotaxis protein CheA [uncultured Aquitalea sp.]|uniref:chemotaxis protein CheA n=1 Tax=uncultured Aquitalea sp. TaxID=540272 RepID=UPI0025F47178|nr:chemotaxis protein CheA [uncultured Aquitalea sp.]